MLNEIQVICKILDKNNFSTGPLHSLLNTKQISNDTYEIAKKLNLIEEIGKNTQITKAGITFFSVSETLSTLNDMQKNFIFENCVIENKKLEEVNTFLLNFQHDGDFVYKLFENEIEEKNIPSDNYWLSFLEELGVVEFDAKTKSYTITKKYLKSFTRYKLSNKIRKKRKKTQAELDLSEKEKKRIGDRGEKLALEYERNLLEQKGWKNRVADFDEANSKENIVAKEHLEVGYDISSYKTKNSDSVDKYIEVKSRKAKEKSFIISEPEILAGQKYSKIKNSYFIYFYYNLGKEEPEEPTKIIPFEKLRIEMCEKCPGLFMPSYKIDIDYLF